MNLFMALIGLIALSALLVQLVRLIARDGLGSTPSPRSHPEELGTWIDRQYLR